MERLEPPSDCVSDLVLDEWLASEFDAAESARVLGHVARCERCSARRVERDTAREAFLRQAPSFDAYAQQVAAHRRRPFAGSRRRRLLVVGSAGALALAAAVLVMLRGAWLAPGEDTRVKGGAHVGFFVKRGERVTRGSPIERVRPGDALRFTYSSASAQHLALINVDARGASVYFPSAGDAAAAVEPGRDVPLDFSVELDEQLGTERIYGVFCPAGFRLEPLRVALGGGLEPPALPDCTIDVITLHKEAAR